MPEVLVQPVDVLGDDRGRLAAADQFGAGAMAAIGGGLAEHVLHGEAAAPGLPARLVRAHEVPKIDRRHFGPDATWAAEIGDAGFGADAGAGEQHDPVGGVDQAGEFFQVVVHVGFSRGRTGCGEWEGWKLIGDFGFAMVENHAGS